MYARYIEYTIRYEKILNCRQLEMQPDNAQKG